MESTAKYRLIEHRDAKKFIKDKPQQFRERIFKAYNEIIENPLDNSNAIKLTGFKNRYRKRVGDFRIIYEVRNNELIIIIVDIDSRGQVYKRL